MWECPQCHAMNPQLNKFCRKCDCWYYKTKHPEQVNSDGTVTLRDGRRIERPYRRPKQRFQVGETINDRRLARQ